MSGGKDERPDRRVRRTRRALRDALLSLILERGHDRVSVQDIIERADVGRSTFYAHFRDKEDLLFPGLDELGDAFEVDERHGTDITTADPSPTLAVFEHFARYHHVWKARREGRGGEVFTRHLHRQLSELLQARIEARALARATRVPADAIAEFAASTLIGLGVRWWVDKAPSYSPEQMDPLYRELTEPGIRAGLQPLP